MNEIEKLYKQYMEYHCENILSGHSNLAIAGILLSQALSIYRSSLSADDYDKMIDFIVDHKDEVKKIQEPNSDFLH